MALQLPTTPSLRLTSLRPPRGRAYDPFVHADALGIQVIFRDLTQSHELWMPAFNTIVLKSRMRPLGQRCALAHGIGHAALGHVTGAPSQELQADRYASLNLIDPTELARTIVWAANLVEVALELGVTQRLLSAYLTRVVA
jgi:hypothetical protein